MAKKKAGKFRDRIKDLRRVKASELIPNPENWRTHSQGQQDALRTMLSEIGWADAVLVRETPDGLQLIDGHLRGDIAGDTEVPVLVLDVDEDESRKILLTHDPIGAMAGVDVEKLNELLKNVDVSEESLTNLLNGLKLDAGIDLPDMGEAETVSIKDEFAVIIECDTEGEQVALLDEMQKRNLKCRALL